MRCTLLVVGGVDVVSNKNKVEKNKPCRCLSDTFQKKRCWQLIGQKMNLFSRTICLSSFIFKSS